jgi:uncharacterized protein YdhG (YjbR/CyaY superfamily)
VKSNPASALVREYFAAATPRGRRALTAIRDAIRKAAPGAEEHFSYRIPAFRFEGRPLVWYAAFKGHASLFPISAAFARAHGIDVSPYQTAKGTIRFPLDRPIPVQLVKRLVRARAADARARRTKA